MTQYQVTDTLQSIDNDQSLITDHKIVIIRDPKIEP